MWSGASPAAWAQCEQPGLQPVACPCSLWHWAYWDPSAVFMAQSPPGTNSPAWLCGLAAHPVTVPRTQGNCAQISPATPLWDPMGTPAPPQLCKPLTSNLQPLCFKLWVSNQSRTERTFIPSCFFCLFCFVAHDCHWLLCCTWKPSLEFLQIWKNLFLLFQGIH